jgi:hypothetical protein
VSQFCLGQADRERAVTVQQADVKLRSESQFQPYLPYQIEPRNVSQQFSKSLETPVFRRCQAPFAVAVSGERPEKAFTKGFAAL